MRKCVPFLVPFRLPWFWLLAQSATSKLSTLIAQDKAFAHFYFWNFDYYRNAQEGQKKFIAVKTAAQVRGVGVYFTLTSCTLAFLCYCGRRKKFRHLVPFARV